MKRVIIVAEGSWGDSKPPDYQVLIEMYKRIVEEAKGPKGEKEATVEIVKTADEAERIIKSAPVNNKIEAVIFVSRGMELTAEKFASCYPKTRMIVFTGLIPEGKVIWVRKSVVTDFQTIQNIILDSG